MRKITVFLICLAVLCSCLLYGCGKAPETVPETVAEGTTFPEISPDFFYLASEQVYYECEADGYGQFYVPLISGSPLKEGDLEIELAGKSITDEQGILGSVPGREEKVELPFYVYQTFRGKDWKAETALQMEYREAEKSEGSESPAAKEAARKLTASQNEFLQDYEAMKKAGTLPVLYRYLVTFSLFDTGRLSEEPITEVTLRVNGIEKVFPVGGISYARENALPPAGPDTLTESRGIAGWHGVCADGKGNLTENGALSDCRSRAEEDLTIKGIDLWEDDRELSDIQLIILNPPAGDPLLDEHGNEVNDIVADYLWDGSSPISLLAGQELAVNFTLHDPRLENAICGYTEYTLALHYENADGETGIATVWYPSRIETASGDPFEIYLQYVLDMDMMSYYDDYYNVLEPTGGIVTLGEIKEG